MSENKKSIIRLIISAAIIGAVIGLIYLIFYLLGWTELTEEQLQEYISSTGAIAPLVYIFVSFLQVTFVPIPGAVTILAGNILFDSWLAFFYSYIGMMAGAMLAFFLGKLLGRPYVNWVAGSKEKADEWIKKLKGREKVFLFFAFLLPLFPDDLLCAVAGVMPISWLGFFIMQLITRATSIGATLLFMSGEVIPYDGWGLPVLIVLAILAIVAFILAIKFSVQINAVFERFIDKLSGKMKKTKQENVDKKNSEEDAKNKDNIA